ncbi:MAG: glucose-1-phosphate adenylyltransferase [candidate division KSB1 bacterium]|nr:glucose-1-phosphate adenylyltransferase [candidate division KSB1 bacterium]
MRNVVAIILGGGQGTRLHPLTKLRAKPAVPIAGKYRLIDIPISNCINSGIQKIFVLTQFNSASLNRHINLAYQFGHLSDGFVEVLAAQQTPENQDWFQGTADAVRQCLRQIEEFKVTDLLILSGDHLYRMDYHRFIDEHRESNADVTIPVIGVGEHRASSFGLLKIDKEKNVLEFSEKPKGDDLKKMRVDTTVLGLNPEQAEQQPYIASMGIYAFKRDVLLELLKRDHKKTDFGKEIIPAAIGEKIIKTYLFDDYWEDIGTIQSFYKANMDLLKYPNPAFSFHDPSAPLFTRQRFLPPTKIIDCHIESSMITEGCTLLKSHIRNSLIGIRTYINENAIIENSLIMGADFLIKDEKQQALLDNGEIPIGVGPNTVIKRAIVDKNARIGANVRIINQDDIQESEREAEGFYIRDGIVVITKNAVIKEGTVI